MIRFGQPKVGRLSNNANVSYVVSKAVEAGEHQETIDALNAEIVTLNETIVSKDEEIATLTQQLEDCQNPSKVTKKKSK